MEAVSLLDDVLGPVMRGPSSSHTAGAHRLARLAAVQYTCAGHRIEGLAAEASRALNTTASRQPKALLVERPPTAVGLGRWSGRQPEA